MRWFILGLIALIFFAGFLALATALRGLRREDGKKDDDGDGGGGGETLLLSPPDYTKEDIRTGDVGPQPGGSYSDSGGDGGSSD